MDNVVIENAQIMYPNFSGQESDYNPKDARNFCVVLDPERAAILTDDGWNVRYTKPNKDGIETPYLKVGINFHPPKFIKPPVVYLYIGETVTELTEETIGCLDSADIISCDMSFRRHVYNAAGKVSAKLSELYVYAQESALAAKHRAIRESMKRLDDEEE